MFASYQDAPRPWTRTSTALLVVLTLGAFASLFFWVHHDYDINEATNDASLYIVCAKSILRGEGYSYLGMPFTIRPPGFSLLIAPILAARGTDYFALNWFVSLWGVACVSLLFVYAHRWLGAWIAFALSVLVWLTPSFQRLCNMTLSDVPGAALILACLLIERWSARKPKLRREIVLGLAIAVATYVRSVSILLIPAIVCARIAVHVRERSAEKWIVFLRRRALVFSAVAVLAVLPWSVRDRLLQPAPPADQNYLHSYSTAMWHQDAGDPSSPCWTIGEILQRVPLRTDSNLSVLGTSLGTTDGSATFLAIGFVVFACLLTALVRRRDAGEFFALAVIGVLSIYFAYQGRLMLPAWLLALVATADTLVWLLSKPLRPHVARAIVAVVIALLVIPIGVVGYDKEHEKLYWIPRSEWPLIHAYHEAYESICKDFRDALPPDAVCASAVGWHYAVYLDRPVYSMFFDAKRNLGDLSKTEALLDKYGINTVVLSKNVAADLSFVPYFKNKYGPPSGTETNLVFRVRK